MAKVLLHIIYVITGCNLKQWDTTTHPRECPDPNTDNIKGVEQQELSSLLVVQPLWKIVWGFLRKWNILLSQRVPRKDWACSQSTLNDGAPCPKERDWAKKKQNARIQGFAIRVSSWGLFWGWEDGVMKTWEQLSDPTETSFASTSFSQTRMFLWESRGSPKLDNFCFHL